MLMLPPASSRPRRCVRAGGRRGGLVWAAVVALLVGAGAAAAVGAYYVQHRDARISQLDHDWVVRVRPLQPGPYQLDVPLPVDRAGDPARIALQASGPVQFGVTRTAYGAALSLRGEGAVELRQAGGLPLRLSMDDQRTSFAQFKFWLRLAEGSPPVNVTLALGERNFTQDWEQTARLGHTIFLQSDLEPKGWQRVRAEHDFDIYLAGGTGQDFPRLAIGALAASLGAMYLPLGLAVARGRKP